jgi:glycosyltransferase involved in cell wall biosynthesis
MKVSIVLTNYNYKPYLKECLDSIFAQSFQDFEIVVIDNGSSDGSRELINSYKDKRIRVFTEPRKGTAHCLNLGMKEARGEYVTFFSSDDRMHPQRLEAMSGYLDANPQMGIVICRVELFTSNNRYISTYPTRFSRSQIKIRDLWRFSDIPSYASLMRLDSIRALGWFDLNIWCEDFDMFCRFCATYPAGYIDRTLEYRREHSGNKSNNWRALALGTLCTFRKFKKENPEKIKEIGIWWRIRMSELYRLIGRGYLSIFQFKRAKFFLFKSLMSYPFDIRSYKLFFKYLLIKIKRVKDIYE